jgi:hypothetical protein
MEHSTVDSICALVLGTWFLLYFTYLMFFNEK